MSVFGIYLTGMEIANMCHMLGIKWHRWSYEEIALADRCRNYWAADIPETRFDRLVEAGFVKSYRREIMTSTQIGFTVTAKGYDTLFNVLMGMRWSERNALHKNRDTRFPDLSRIKVATVTK